MGAQYRNKGLPRLCQLEWKECKNYAVYSLKPWQKLYASKYPCLLLLFDSWIGSWKLKSFLRKNWSFWTQKGLNDFRINFSKNVPLLHWSISSVLCCSLWQLWRIALTDHFRVLCGDAAVVYKWFVSAALRGGLLLLIGTKGVCRGVHRMLLKSSYSKPYAKILIIYITICVIYVTKNH